MINNKSIVFNVDSSLKKRSLLIAFAFSNSTRPINFVETYRNGIMSGINFIYKISLLVSIILLNACGGATTTATATFTTLSVLGNNDGIARGVTNVGTEALVYSPDITGVVASANASTSSDIANVNSSDFPVTSLNGNVQMRTGTMTSDGVTLNLTVVEDTRVTANESGIVTFTMPSGYNDLHMVTGSAYSNAPTGSFTYAGTQITTSGFAAAPGATGSFSLAADFSQKTFQYNGSSGSVSVAGSGVLDTVNGRYATSGLTVNSGSSTYTGTMHGLMHGSGASSTTGIFHTTSNSNPAIIGAFVGSK